MNKKAYEAIRALADYAYLQACEQRTYMRPKDLMALQDTVNEWIVEVAKVYEGPDAEEV